jgi:hypothetical protein
MAKTPTKSAVKVKDIDTRTNPKGGATKKAAVKIR